MGVAGAVSYRDIPKEGERFLASGDESGTAPRDRSFRPDVEGLRAVAVLLVVLFHAGVSTVSGGYIGVDVFFVISGFVITGVLLRERASSGRTSILTFYGRRCRRIIPAATLVIIATVSLSFIFLGAGAGDRTATDGRWATVFLANFHFNAIGTNYLSSQLPPSPLQNFWSLAVEEQFYIVYPTLFLLLAGIRTHVSLRARLALGLTVIICASLAFSIVSTSSDPTGAYFSPFTRAWELAIGALAAVGTPWLLKLPIWVAAGATWLGLGAIIGAAVGFTSVTSYPGSAVTIPVIGSALIVAGGVAAPRLGVEALLRLAPFQMLGKLSYSLYLWHWPILMIAAQNAGKTSLTVPQNLMWVVVALITAVASYRLVENPIRHARLFSRRRMPSVGLGVVLVAGTLSIIAVQSDLFVASGAQEIAGPRVQTEISYPISALATYVYNPIGNPWRDGTCFLNQNQSPSAFRNCVESGTKPLVVLYGDSHAAQLYPALSAHPEVRGYRLAQFTASACIPALGVAETNEPHCEETNVDVVQRIRRLHPYEVILGAAWYAYQPSAIEDVGKTIHALRRDGVKRIVLLGSSPYWTTALPTALYQYGTLHPGRPLPYRMNFDLRRPLMHFFARVVAGLAHRNRVPFVQPTTVLCDQSGCLTRLGGRLSQLTQFDAAHLTNVGAEYVLSQLRSELLPGVPDR